MRCLVARLVRWITLGLIGAALYDQLRRAPAERTWVGHVGPVPYDFRRPSLERLRASLYDPANAQLFTPIAWGIGWSLNLATAQRVLGPCLERARTSLSALRAAR
ncbi:MAG: hypothetical protein RMH81_01965 [Thermomicrobium sp.]|nr:hypothetical protein [Thermomicrobium sp.]